MVLIAFLAFVFFAVAVALVVSAGFQSGGRRAENLEQIVSYGYAGVSPHDRPKRTFKDTLDELAAAIGTFFVAGLARSHAEVLQRRLIAAGFFGIGARRFMGYRVMLTVALPVLTIWLLGVARASGGVIVFLSAALAIAGWVVPSIVLSRRARLRLAEIDYALPELIDLLVVTLEAGVAFAAALQIAADRLEGPLGEEVRLTIQEQSLGLSMVVALENWLGRCDTPSVRSFVRSMIQGQRLGVSIGQILRSLAVEMRARRHQTVEERAQKAPVKIMFPLVFLIFPAMFLILLGPVLFRLSGTFGH